MLPGHVLSVRRTLGRVRQGRSLIAIIGDHLQARDIPTVGETLVGFEVVAWVGMMAPAATPRPIVDKLAAEVKRILALPDVNANLDSVGGVAATTSPEEFGAFLKEERERWEGVIKGLGLLGSN